MKALLLFISLTFLFPACKNEPKPVQSSKPVGTQLEMIKVVYEDAFNRTPFTLTYHLNNRSLLYHKNERGFLVVGDDLLQSELDSLIALSEPITKYAHIDSTDHARISDSILSRFSKIDFRDTTFWDVDDGSTLMITWAYSNDSTHLTTLVNASTPLQKEFLEEIFSWVMKYSRINPFERRNHQI